MFQFLGTWLSFDNSRRLLLGFDSPIEAGILLAVIIPWVGFTAWSASSLMKKSVAVALLVCEITLLYLLSWTGSRGPMIALIAACFLGAGLCFREKRPAQGRLLLFRSLAMTALLVAFVSMNGFGGRFASAVASTDVSVLNRWEIIKNARGLLLLDPVSGSGWGWAGFHYSHWFEPQHLRHLYTGLTNEYLQLGTEVGLPAFFLMLAGAGAILAAPWVANSVSHEDTKPRCSERKRQSAKTIFFFVLSRLRVRFLPVWRHLFHRAYLSCVTLAIVACMTTFHNSTTLATITIAMFAASCLLARVWRNRAALFAGLAAATLGILALLCIPPHKQPLGVSLRGSGKQFIELQAVGAAGFSTLNGNFPLVLVDKNVLGHVYGQSLRLLLPDKPFHGKMLVALPNAGAFRSCPKAVDTCVAFGASINSDACSMLPPLERLVIVHPAMPPPERLPKAARTLVMLPAIDEAGVNAQWKQFCKAKNIPCIQTRGTGLDIQSRTGGFFDEVY